MKPEDKSNEKISDALNVDFEIVQKNDDKPLVKVINTDQQDYEKDYTVVRKNLKELIDIGEEAIDGILNVAKNGDSPRAYEVAGQMIKTVSEMNKDLIDLHKKVKDISKTEVVTNNTTNNSIYVGSTSELQDLVNQSRSRHKALQGDSELNNDE